MECSVDARSEGQPGHPPPEKLRWMVCRVPVAFQIATGDDARSLRLPDHPVWGAMPWRPLRAHPFHPRRLSLKLDRRQREGEMNEGHQFVRLSTV